MSESREDDVVSGEIHVSCYITAANRAAPVFEVALHRNSVRCVAPPLRDGGHSPSSSPVNSSSHTDTTATTNGSAFDSKTTTAEWDLHAVFRPNSPSLDMDFYREITQPALHNACRGINTNLIASGVHPTQKFRLLFGKSTGLAGAPHKNLSKQDATELYGQLGALLHEFFSRNAVQASDGWRLGISSWVVVNNQAVDLLKAPTPRVSPPAQASSRSPSSSFTFVSLEARSLSGACRILQTAKTNRIVVKQNAEHAHFFLRLAFFHHGQVSSLHVVDLVDLKDFTDPVAAEEKRELLEILQELRQPLLSTRQGASSLRASLQSSIQPRPASASDQDSSPPTVDSPLSPGLARYQPRSTVLANFLLPLLTANAQTFLYANIIDSRSNLRESVALLNAVANLKGYTCLCRRLRGVDFDQLGFHPPPDEPAPDETREPLLVAEHQTQLSVELQAAVIVGESMLSRLAASGSPPDSPDRLTTEDLSLPSDQLQTADAGLPSESEAMQWLEDFQQRKRDILGGQIDTISPTREVQVLARSRVDAVQCMDVADVDVEMSDDVRLHSPHTPSVNEIYERLRQSMQSNSSASDVNSPRSVQSASSPLAPHTLESIHNTPQAAPGLSEHPADLTTLAGAASRPRRPLSRGSDDSSRYGDYGYSGIHELADRVNVETGGNDRNHDTPAPTLSETHREEFVRATSSDVRLPPTTPKRSPQRAKHAVQHQSPSPRSYSKPIETPIDFEAQCDRAGVPVSVLTPPPVEGLDAATANKVQAADAALLRKNYDALLTIVREQQKFREDAEGRAAEAHRDMEELRAMFELQIENMKLASVTLRRKIRVLEKHTAVPQVFEQYDQEVDALNKQVQQLQARNVALELKLSSSDSYSSGPDFRKKYQQAVDEKLKLEQELAAHRKRERQFLVYNKLIDDSTRKVDKLSKDLSEKEEVLVATRLGKLRLNAEMNQAVEKAELLNKENAQLLLDKAATTEELLATKMYLASVETEQKKAEILDRFVKKHGYRMSQLRDDPKSSRGTHWPQWQRTSETKEAEDKLFAAVKRSLPHAVPLVNKLLRRLELQEMSLREFSEREVDFINLLVELVSDQPTATLKSMIEDEMQKLRVG